MLNQTRYIRANSAILARLAFNRAFDGSADHVSLVGQNHAASIGSARIYDDIASPIGGDGISGPNELSPLAYAMIYKPSSKAMARNVAIKGARANRAACGMMAKIGRKLAAMQAAQGLTVSVKL